MSEFAPPSGPPPPKVPEGWKAVWNAQYSEWFFVNIYTKKSQWDKPDHPVYPAGEAPPDGPPPTYAPSDSHAPTDDKKLSSNNPYAGEARKSHDLSEDERLARQLQDEENARAHGGQTDNRGLADAYYGQQQGGSAGYGGQGSPYPPQNSGAYPQQSPSPFSQQQDTYASSDKGKSKGGLLGKLLGKANGGGSKPSYGAPGGYGGYGQQQPGYGPPGGGYYPQGQPGYAQQGYYPQQAAYGQPGRKKPGGLGMGGAAALGVGGGLLGGALIGSALADDGGNTYVENNYGDDDGGDFGGDDGADFGGGDF